MNIFKAMIFTRQFYNLKHTDRNNLITRVFDFLQPRLRFFISVVQSFLGLTTGFMSNGHAKTPMPKAT